jgi:hypothetical protein
VVSVDPHRRAQIIAETRAILQRHSERRSRPRWSDAPSTPPIEDEVARWRREGIVYDELPERAFMTDMMRDTVAAVSEITDATSAKFSELDGKLNRLAELLRQLREGNERSRAIARARAEVIDLPPSPKDLN